MRNENIDLNLFRIFDCVMVAGGITAAATRLGMTTPAVSQAISRFTSLIGEPLFRRQGRGIMPTSRALSLHKEIQEPLYSIERSLLSSNNFFPAISTRLFRIASHPDLDVIVLPLLLKHTSQIAPNCKIEFLPKFFEESIRQQALRQHNVDLVLSSSIINEPGFYHEKLLDLELRVACKSNHPRIINTLSFEQFFVEEHIVWDVRQNDDWVIKGLARDGLPPRKIAYESNSQFTALSLASHTNWIFVTSQWHLGQVREAFELQDFPVPWSTAPCPVYLSWHQSLRRDAGLLWLITQLRSLFSEPQ